MEVSMATNTSLDVLIDLDALSVIARAEVMTRVNARQKFEAAWTSMVAAQGTKEGMESLTKPWSRMPEKTADDLLRDLNLPGQGSV